MGKSTVSQPGYRAIPLATIRMDSVTDFDIHIQTAPDREPVLYRERHLEVTPAVIAILEEQRHRQVFIPTAQAKQYRQYIVAHLDSILQDPTLPIGDKCEVLYDSAQGLVADVLEEPRSRELLLRSKRLVASTVDFMTKEQDAFRFLVEIVSYDYYIFTHSVNVSIYSIALAQRLGGFTMAALRELGEGALLHDVGKCLIDPAITQSEHALSEEEWRAMQQHPTFGYEILTEHGLVGAQTLEIVRHHHEKLDGSGYPDGLRGEEIRPLVRVTTIADIFDAITTRRCYRDAVGSFDALKLMRSQMTEQLDQTYFRVFVQLLGQPVA